MPSAAQEGLRQLFLGFGIILGIGAIMILGLILGRKKP